MEDFYKILKKRLFPKEPSTKKIRPKSERRRLTPFQKWKLNGGVIHPRTTSQLDQCSDYENYHKIRQPFTELQNISPTSSMLRPERKVKMHSLITPEATYQDVYGNENNNNATQVLMPRQVQVDHFSNYPSSSSYFNIQSHQVNQTLPLQNNFKEYFRENVADQDFHHFRLQDFNNDSQHELPVLIKKQESRYFQDSSNCTNCCFLNLVLESNGKLYAENSNVNRNFLQLLEDDVTDNHFAVMESEPVNIHQCQTSPTYSSIPTMDSELAFVLSESSLVVECGNLSFFDILQDVHDTGKEEKYLAKNFLEVFEGVEKLNTITKQERKVRNNQRRRAELECQIVFNGQESWLGLWDLKNEVSELNVKSDLVYRTADDDITNTPSNNSTPSLFSFKNMTFN